MTAIDAKILGESPNEKWMVTGQFIIVVGVAVYIGFSGFGVEIGKATDLGPFVLMAGGVLSMLYGTKLKKEKHVREQQHELRIAEQRTVSEPTEGDTLWWNQFKLEAPVNARELEALNLPHDRSKTKEQLLASLNYQRCQGWIYRDKIVEYGNSYDTKEHFDANPKTVFK